MTDYPPQLPHGEIVSVFRDVFVVQGQIIAVFGEVRAAFSRTMTIIRDGKDLTLYNTIRLDDAGLAALDELGQVKNIVRLGAFHGRDDAFYLNRDTASMWALAGTDHQRGVVADRTLVAGQCETNTDATVVDFGTQASPEAAVHLSRNDGLVITCDSFQNMLEPDQYFDEPTAALMAKGGFFRSANIGRGWINAGAPGVGHFDSLFDLKFSHLFSAHGLPLLDVAYAAMAASVKQRFGS